LREAGHALPVQAAALATTPERAVPVSDRLEPEGVDRLAVAGHGIVGEVPAHELRDRLAQFGLELASEKTRLIEFGRFAAERRQKRGLGKPVDDAEEGQRRGEQCPRPPRVLRGLTPVAPPAAQPWTRARSLDLKEIL
jgi:hypothetical protein